MIDSLISFLKNNVKPNFSNIDGLITPDENEMKIKIWYIKKFEDGQEYGYFFLFIQEQKKHN